MPKTIVIDPVMTKSFKRFGHVYPSEATEYKATIVPGKSIRVQFQHKSMPDVTADKTFQVGDIAEYDSYNLIYTGVITKITAKTVTIVAYKGTANETPHRLNLEQFCWRNHNFDAAEVADRNADTMMRI